MSSSAFNDKNIKSLSLNDATRIEWQQSRNKLANLQLLEGRENESKNDMSLIDWLKEPINSKNVKYLPSGISYELRDFDKFIIERQKGYLYAKSDSAKQREIEKFISDYSYYLDFRISGLLLFTSNERIINGGSYSIDYDNGEKALVVIVEALSKVCQ